MTLIKTLIQLTLQLMDLALVKNMKLKLEESLKLVLLLPVLMQLFQINQASVKLYSNGVHQLTKLLMQFLMLLEL